MSSAAIYEDDETRAAKIRAEYGDPREHGAECDSCPIRDQEHFVPPQTAVKLRLVLVGEGPGRYEQLKAQCFCGPSGKLLDSALMHAGIERRHAHVTNTMLCLEGQVLVRMADGRSMRINEIVKKAIRDEVLTVERDGSIGQRPITGWYRSPRAGRRILKVTHAFSKGNPRGTARVLMTEDHRVLTERGWRQAKEIAGLRIATGDRAPIGSTREIAIGTLLGDATIPRTSRCLQLTHAEDQREYAEAKARAFEAHVWSFPRPGIQRVFGFRSYASGFFGEMRAHFYPRGKKRIPTDVANNLSDLSLAIWFMDDGYMRLRDEQAPSAEICAAGFPRKDVARVVRRLRARGFDCKISRRGRPTRIHFSWKGAYVLSDRIARFVPPQMQYKLVPKHRGQFDPRTFDPHHGPFYAEAIVEEVKPAKNTQTVYCIDVEKTHNFITTTAVVHNCRPESEDQIPGAVAACSRRLFRELRALDASAPIVALGKESARALLGAKSILKSRGFLWKAPALREGETIRKLKRERRNARAKNKESTAWNLTLKIRRNAIAGRTVFPVLHPAFILRMETWAPIFDIDIDRVARFLANGNSMLLEDERPYTVVSKTSALRRLLRKWKFWRKDVLVDIETDSPDPLSAKLLCVGIGVAGKKPRTIVCYPWRPKMADVLQELFDGGAKFTGHNVITFDCLVMERYGVSVGILEKASMADRVEDTLVAHHSFASHLPKSLAHVASCFVDARPWKIIAKGSGKSEKGQLPHQLSPDELCRYNAGDVNVNAPAWERMQADLESERDVYAITKRLGALCARMRWRGFAFDTAFAKDLSRQLLARKQNLLWEMRDLIGDDEFKPSRAFDLRQVLFTRLKVPLIYPTKSGLPATSRVVLEQLRHGQDLAGKLCDLILRWRDCQKTLSTYLSVDTRNGRVHGDWRIATVSGRLGGRLLTLPRYTSDKELVVAAIAKFEKHHKRKPEAHEKKALLATCIDITDQVRKCYIAPPGRILIYWDLSQAEMRFAANLSGDQTFIDSCKGDVHVGNAKVLFPQEVKDGFFATDKEAKEGRGKPFRDIAKNAGFAVTYLAEAETVYVYLNAHGFPVSLMEARTMLDRLHIAYAGYFDYVKKNVAFVQANGWLRSVASGRIRYFGHTPKPTEVANFPVQTGIADMMNVRLLDVEARLPQTAFIVAQIHDAAIIEADEGDVDVVKQIIADIFGPPVVLPDRAPFTIPAETKVATRWSEL